MIKTIEILNKLSEDARKIYEDMIKSVNIPDFYKVIAQFSGLNIQKIDDETIADYIITWAKNKIRFYKMLGNKTRLDIPISYMKSRDDLRTEMLDLGKDYPAYYLWFREFENQKTNKVDDIDWSLSRLLSELFPGFKLQGSTMTHFFKSMLKAPDELVTRIGRIFEHDKVESNYTISIDPVDMMLASENPYDWQSCYRLELGRDDSHADGCMASVLDTVSCITYVWDREGEFTLYDTFKFKKIRYYRMREWIYIDDKFGAVHFNAIYPGKDDYDEEFQKLLRTKVEETLCKYTGVSNIWRKNEEYTFKPENNVVSGYWARMAECHRKNMYGYGECDNSYIYINNDIYPKLKIDSETGYVADIGINEFRDKYLISITPYDVKYKCACGCGTEMYGSDEVGGEDDCYDEDTCYNGEGFRCDSFYVNEPEYMYCSYCDGDCEKGLREYDECYCEDCELWVQHNPICCINSNERCHIDPDDEDYDCMEVENGVAKVCKCCKDCWNWKQAHLNNNEGEDD